MLVEYIYTHTQVIPQVSKNYKRAIIALFCVSIKTNGNDPCKA